MTNVLQLDAYRPHREGTAICAACKHTWEAVAPTGVIFLECPECSTLKGQFRCVSEPDDALVWNCNCGSTLFQRFKTKHGVGWMCVNCGIWAEPD